jgi:lipoprotein NlpD
MITYVKSIWWFRLIYLMWLSCAALSTISCTTQPLVSAPVVNAWRDPEAMKSRYRVQKNDTLYSIAWAFDLDYRDLAAANHLVPPYHLKPGQTLAMVTPSNTPEEGTDTVSNPPAIYAVGHFANANQLSPEGIKTKPVMVNESVLTLQEPKRAQKPSEEALILPEWQLQTDTKPSAKLSQDRLSPPQYSVGTIAKPQLINPKEVSLPFVELHENAFASIALKQRNGKWPWPARGEIIKGFSLQGDCCNKGIDIGGQLGDPITAVAPGKVVYSGCGLRGYGNLVIIKHADNYLSAYAYNKKLLVKEGDLVKAGSEIGKMGQNNAGKTLLHFEIRRYGKPVNPLLYL